MNLRESCRSSPSVWPQASTVVIEEDAGILRALADVRCRATGGEDVTEAILDLEIKLAQRFMDLAEELALVRHQARRAEKRFVDLEVEARAAAHANVEAVFALDELGDRAEELETRASLDGLTGVANRAAFDTELRRELRDAQRDNHPLSLLFVDADHFKRINDEHGHAAGDAVLRTLARLIQSQARTGDMTKWGHGLPFASRYGGEEFVVLLPGTPLADAAAAAERLRQVTERSKFSAPSGEPIPVTVSVGVATFTPGDTEESFVGRADAALYRAKAAGRNRVIDEETGHVRLAG